MKSTFSVSRPSGCEHRFAVDFTHGQTLSLIFKAVQYSLCSAVDRFSPSEDEGHFPDWVAIEISRPAESLLILRVSFKTGAMPNYRVHYEGSGTMVIPMAVRDWRIRSSSIPASPITSVPIIQSK